MATDALCRLAARLSSTKPTSGGYSGYSGYSLERSEVFCTHLADASGYSGYNSDPSVPAVPAADNVLGTEKPRPPSAVTAVPAVPTEDDEGGNAGTFAAAPEPDEWGLSRYTIRNLANWYEEEANRRRVGLELDQNALDRDLRRRIAEHGVRPEFNSIEFERVMQAVFAVPATGSLEAHNIKDEKAERRVEAASTARASMAAKPSYAVIGPARPGSQCENCSKGIGVYRIKYRGQEYSVHRHCAASRVTVLRRKEGHHDPQGAAARNGPAGGEAAA